MRTAGRCRLRRRLLPTLSLTDRVATLQLHTSVQLAPGCGCAALTLGFSRRDGVMEHAVRRSLRGMVGRSWHATLRLRCRRSPHGRWGKHKCRFMSSDTAQWPRVPHWEPSGPVAVLYQARPAPAVDGVVKPMKPGGYSDSGADVAFALAQCDVPRISVTTPVACPDAAAQMDWVRRNSFVTPRPPVSVLALAPVASEVVTRCASAIDRCFPTPTLESLVRVQHPVCMAFAGVCVP